MSADIRELDDSPITLAPGNGRADSELRRFAVGDSPLYVLKQRGRFADIAYDHGRLLAAQVGAGAFPEIVSVVCRGIDREKDLLDRVAATAYQAYSSRVLANTSAEFRAGVDALADGYVAGDPNARFTRQDVRDATVAIEVGNLIDGLSRRFAIKGARLGAGLGLVALCLPYLFDQNVARRLHQIRADARRPGSIAGNLRSLAHPAESIGRALGALASPRNRYASGCTGFCAGGRFTRDGRHIHGRNFDGDLYQWNTAPVLALIDETAADPAWHKYVAFGTAGLIYPGGISGLNDAGLAVSLHQLSTTRYKSGFRFGHGDIAPFFEQRVLREAATLDEAADLARATRHFAAWTIFCSDAKSGDGMRIEVNADKVRITRSAEPLPQSNHFVHADMVERAFDSTDGHFTPSFGKWLETHARLALVDDALARAAPKREIDVAWGIELLASGEDWTLNELVAARGGGGAVLRSFGRVPRKTYNQLTSIAVADPARRHGADEVWLTSGDRRPACQSTFSGWRIDWQPFAAAPVAESPLRRTEAPARAGRARWEVSLERYVEACMAVTRPRHGDGVLMGRDPTDAEHHAALGRAEALLDAAIGLAGEDGVTEIPYHYMRARIRHERGDAAGARADWDALRDIWARQGDGAPPMHPYEAALVDILSTVSEDAARGAHDWPGRAARLAAARAGLAGLGSANFGAGAGCHFDLDRWRALIDTIEADGGAAAALPDENFITVE